MDSHSYSLIRESYKIVLAIRFDAIWDWLFQSVYRRVGWFCDYFPGNISLLQNSELDINALHRIVQVSVCRFLFVWRPWMLRKFSFCEMCVCVECVFLCFSFSFYWCCHFFSLKTKGNLKCFHLNDWKLDRLISATWFFINTHQSIENGVHNYYFQFLSSANLMIKLWLVEFFTIMNCV